MGDEEQHDFGSLAVCLVMAPEVERCNALLDEHHYPGHNLVGRVLRYIAYEDDDQWAALIGFGSPALSLRARERFIGWNEEAKSRRLRFVLNNQRFCVLPGRRHRKDDPGSPALRSRLSLLGRPHRSGEAAKVLATTPTRRATRTRTSSGLTGVIGWIGEVPAGTGWHRDTLKLASHPTATAPSPSKEAADLEAPATPGPTG